MAGGEVSPSLRARSSLESALMTTHLSQDVFFTQLKEQKTI